MLAVFEETPGLNFEEYLYFLFPSEVLFSAFLRRHGGDRAGTQEDEGGRGCFLLEIFFREERNLQNNPARMEPSWL